MIYFAPGSLEKALADIKRTKLEAYFSLNASLPRERRLRYPDVPLHYTWNGKERRWDPRLQLPHAEIITRMVQVSTREVERHSLRELLLRIRDATSFEDMKRPRSATLELLEAGQPSSLTYRDALRRLGNEGDQEHADRTLHELVRDSDASPMELLRTFATLLAFSNIPDAKALWAKYQTHFTGGQGGSRNAYVALVQLWAMLRDYGMDPTRTTLQQPGLQLGCANPPDVIMREQMRWERRRQEETVAENLVLMNDDQRRFFDRVRAAVTNGEPLLCYLDGPAGTGKTLLFSTVLALVRARQEIALPMAWSGLAATVLPGGRTVHATFKLPVPMPTADASSTLEAQTDNGSLVRAARLIIWDEAPNAPRAAFEAVERTCRYLSGDDTRLFGGKIVLLGGDFRQIPPVVRHASVQEVAHLTLQAWRPYIENAERFALTDNMRAREDPAFARFVLAIGNAEMPGDTIDVDTTRITLPRAVQVVDSPEDLATWVAEGVRQPRDWLHNAIICPTNDAVLHANELVHAMHVQREEQEEGEAERDDRGQPRRRLEEHAADGDSLLLRSYVSEDAVFTDDPDTQDMVTKEFLHDSRGMPDVGLCNGTRIRVLRTFEHSIQAQILQIGPALLRPAHQP